VRLPSGAPLSVALALLPREAIAAGRLALDRAGAVFEYDPAFVLSGRRLNPLDPPRAGPIAAREPRVFDGLHGVFADSLPDAWGTELLRRRCARAGIRYDSLTVLDRLAVVGKRGMGALVYQPAIADDGDDRIELDRLAEGAEAILEGRDTDVLPELERLGGSSGGARPKVLVAIDSRGHTISGTGDIPRGYDAWLVKFRASHDRPDAAALEATYAALAREAGIDVPDHRVIASAARAPGYFASKRFDRGPNGERRHVVSAAGALDLDWTVPQIDYHGLLQLVRRVTRDQTAVEEMFRRMLFNVAAHNRDDHAKQHSFILAADGRWQLAPAYDLTFSNGPGGEHYLAVSGEARDIGSGAVASLAAEHGMKPRRLRAAAGDVLAALARFAAVARDYGVSTRTRVETEAAIRVTAGRLISLGKHG
jgi:serine/threonine-protein kinase HipA